MADELLTILFTDVEGSTALHAAKGDAEPRRILGACDEFVLREAVVGYHTIGMPRHEAMARDLLAGIDAGCVRG